MTYIRDLDPQWHDPRLDVPVTCVGCGTKATVEDFTEVTDPAGNPGLLCPWCNTVNWEEDQ